MPEVIERIVYRYDELSPRAKERALDQYRQNDLHDEWWDSIYEDAVAVAALLGIEIGTRSQRSPRGKTYQEPQLFFSGFSSQGDGACFAGSYRHPDSDIVKAITAYAPQDEELKRIAEGLTVSQVTARMKYGGQLEAKITTSGNYSHSGTMNFDVSITADPEDYDDNFADLEADLIRLLRDFADWIYKQLEAESDYLNSEEYIAERFADNEDRFDEDGVMI